MIRKRLVSLFLLLFVSQTLLCQGLQLSVDAQVSIITVGPGKNLYEKFGHSAIEIEDSVLQLDLVYNYGIFNFNAPHFYTNFAQGKLLYRMERYPLYYLIGSNREDKRWIKKQVLNLTPQEKQHLFNYLENNAKPKNASYLYDPFFNNCATKLRDIIQIILNNRVHFSSDFAIKSRSFRELMNSRIHWNTWGSLGINLCLGREIDHRASAKEYLYLPDYIFKGFANATITTKDGQKKLIKKTETLLDFKPIQPTSELLSPFLIFGIFTLIGLWITYRDYQTKKRTKWLDFVLFFITGIVGLLIVFLWFFTNRTSSDNNFNFLWAFAPNLVVAFVILKKCPPKWIKKYLQLLLILGLFIPIIWIGKIQLMPLSLLPLFILLWLRYFLLQQKLLN